MSFKTALQKKSVRFGGTGIIAASVTALILGNMFAPASGATFSASGTGSGTVKTGTLGISLADAHNNTGTFNLEYDNIVPNDNGVSDTFTVGNTGSVPANVVLTPPAPPTAGIANASPDDTSLLEYRVEGFTDWQPVVAGNNPANVSLGSIAGNSKYTYTVDVRLRSTADNTWQGATVSGQMTVTLNQQ